MSDDAPHVEELLQRARDGDQAALDALFQCCRNYLGVVARAQVETWLRAKVDASDVVQQTMLEAHRGFGQFQGQTEQEWLAWLRQILNHNAADFIRRWRYAEKRKISREVSLEPPGRSSLRAVFEPAGDEESPSQQAIRQERELLVADALSRLPEDYREVIILRNLQRLSFNEVAERMDRSRPAVQMLWTRAIRKLRDEVGHRE